MSHIFGSGLWKRLFGNSSTKELRHSPGHSRFRTLRTEPLEARAMLAVSPSALLPDLTVWASQSNGFMYDWTVQGDELRLTTAMANIGAGRMELRGGSSHGDTQDVFQRVYEPNGAYTDVLAGAFIYHPEHGHIHFENFAQFRLLAVDPNMPGSVGQVLRAGSKTSYCLLDVEAYNTSLPGASQSSFFRNCGQVQGISVGWADVYDRGLEGQSIDITGITNGTYWLEAEVDPDNHLIESNESNNVTRIQITINGRGGGSAIPPDAFESNNTFSTASILAPPEDHLYESLSIHAAGNADYYRVTATNSGPLTFRLNFQHSQGDIDMEVLSSSNSRLGLSDSVANTEQFTVQAVAGNFYYVRAYGYRNATNPNYSLFVDQPERPGGGEAPTLTTINTLSGATSNANFTISYATLAAAANESDPEGAAVSFRIGEIVSGTLTKNGAAVVPGVTLLSAGESIVWRPPTGASGTGASALSAFKVVAFDGTLESDPPVLVKVDVAAVNQRPTLTTVRTLTGARRNTQFFITYESLLAASNAADPDGNSPLLFHIAQINSGTLRKVSADGTISTISLGSTTIGPGESLRWTPPSYRTGTLNAFRVKIFDGLLDSTPSVQVRITVTN